MKKSYLSKVVSKAIEVAKVCTFDLVKFETSLPLVSKQEMYLLDPAGMLDESNNTRYYSNEDFDGVVEENFGSTCFTRDVIWYDVDEDIVREYVYDLMTVYTPGEIERMMLDGKPIVLRSKMITAYPMLNMNYPQLEDLTPMGGNTYRHIIGYDKNDDPIYAQFNLRDAKVVVFENKLDYAANIFRNRAYSEDGEVPDQHELFKQAVKKIGCKNAVALTTKEFMARNGYTEHSKVARFSQVYDVINNLGGSTNAIFCLIVDGKEHKKNKALIRNMRECDRILVVHTDYIDEDHRNYATEVMTPATYKHYLRGPMDGPFDGATVVSDGHGGYAKLFKAPVDKLSVMEQLETVNIREIYDRLKSCIMACDPDVAYDHSEGYIDNAETCKLYLPKLPALIGMNYGFNRDMLKAINWLEQNTVYEAAITYKQPTDTITHEGIKYAEGMFTKDMPKEVSKYGAGKIIIPAYTANYAYVYHTDKVKMSYDYFTGKTRKSGNTDLSNFDLADIYAQVLELLDRLLKDDQLFDLYKGNNWIICPVCACEVVKDPTGEERFRVDEARVAKFVERTEIENMRECIDHAIEHDELITAARKYLPKKQEREYWCPHCMDTFWSEVLDASEVAEVSIDPCDNHQYDDPKGLHNDDDGDFDEAAIIESI